MEYPCVEGHSFEPLAEVRDQTTNENHSLARYCPACGTVEDDCAILLMIEYVLSLDTFNKISEP